MADTKVERPITGVNVEHLREQVRGRVIAADDEGYNEARAVHNGMFDKRPLAVLRAEQVADVIAGDDVSYLLGAKHGQGTLVKHAVVHGARLVVTLVISSYHAASYLLAQVLDVDSRYRPLDLSVCHCSCLPALCKSSLKPAAAARAFRSRFRPDPVPPS